MPIKSNGRFKSLKLIIKTIPFLWVNDWGLRLRVLLSLIFTGIMIALHVCLPLFFRKIVNSLSSCTPQDPVYLVAMLLVGYGILWTASQIITQLRAIVLYRSLEHSMRLLAMRVFNHLLSLSLRFHLDRKTGAITTAIERAEDGLEHIFWGIFLYVINTLIEIVIVISLLTFLFGWVYSTILAVMMIIYLLFTSMVLAKSVEVQQRYNEKREAAGARLVDTLLNVETVKYFNNEPFEQRQCDAILKEQEDAGVAKYVFESISEMGQYIIIGTGLVLLTWLSGNAVVQGKMTVGDFVLINGYLLQFINPLSYFGYIIRSIRRGLNDVNSAMNLLNLKPEITDKIDAIDLNINSATITFKNVYFSYDERRQILKGVSFTVPAGKSVAIVGPTGSGKSTIARLLYRFYDIKEGAILINGHDIRSITQNSLRSAIGIVPQDTILFNNTLYYNIAYGNPQAPEAEIEQAISMAHLNAFINRLPDGYKTEVGERGLKLSGGEKQRIAIARVLLKKPAIYIFDEATSALDTQTERDIQSNLEEISAGATSLTIAHRLSTVVNSDIIIVLDHGIVAEQGTHQELLERNGLYAKLWYQQMQENH